MRWKRIASLCAAAAVLLSLAACASRETAPAPTPSPEITPTPTATPLSERVLVVVFSPAGEEAEDARSETGSPAVLAGQIAARLGADLCELRAAGGGYPEVWEEREETILREQEEKARPAIGGALPRLDDYDAVFLGAPVWNGDWPMILYTFFEGADLAGKKLIPFCTHEGEGMSELDRKLALACPYSTVEKGLAIKGEIVRGDPDRAERAVNSWLDGLGY